MSDDLVTKLKHLHLKEKAAITLETRNPDYVIQLDAQSSVKHGAAAKVAATTTNKMVSLYTSCDLAYLGGIQTNKEHVTCIKFAPAESSVLVTGTAKNTLCCWDVRTSYKEPVCYLTGHEQLSNVINCIDISQNGKILCAGTSLVGEDAHMLFWDFRKAVLLGSYSESHGDDITTVKFHESNPDSLLSGSVDGLVCLFDISEECEDDALQSTLNSESSVSSVGWCGEETKFIYCLTHMDTMHVWDAAEYDPVANLTNIKETSKIDYLVDVFTEENEIYVLTGTNSGVIHLENYQDGALSRMLSLTGGHKQVVRCCTWDSAMKGLVSGAEDMMVCLWSCSESRETTADVKRKAKAPSHMKQQLSEGRKLPVS